MKMRTKEEMRMYQRLRRARLRRLLEINGKREPLETKGEDDEKEDEGRRGGV